MVRVVLLALALAGWAGAGLAQPPDWTRAGGDLFFRAPLRTHEVVPSAIGEAGVPQPDQPFDTAVSATATRHGLDPKLLHALVAVESGYRTDAVSSAGAGGLTQLMPATAAELGVRDRFDPAENLSGGAAYLVAQLRRFGDLRLALAAFNAGPERVAHLGRVPNIAETRHYVAKVVDCYLALAAGRSIRSASDCRPAGASR